LVVSGRPDSGTNIDIRSFSINYELNAVFYNEQIAKELESDFERDLAYCSEFDPEVYQKRGTALRFRGFGCKGSLSVAVRCVSSSAGVCGNSWGPSTA
jgi:hypothetical protein